MDELLKSPTKQSVKSSVIVSKSGSKEMDKTIASFFYENGISFNVADSSSFARRRRSFRPGPRREARGLARRVAPRRA